MISRGTIIAALFAAELAILGEAVVAIRGGQAAPSSEHRADARTASGPRLVEGGPHRIFEVGAHPALSVDIGYADLTILTSAGSQIDASVSPSNDFGIFRATAPITAGEDGQTIRIATSDRGWSTGDDRMVTVIVPPETAVTVVNAGDIKARGLRAEASLKSDGNGFVTVEDFDAAALKVVASDGRIRLQRVVTARLDVTTSDGRIDGTALQVRDGNVESDNGRVTLGLATGSDTLVNAETSDGRVIISGFAAAAVSSAGKSSDDDQDSASKTVRVGAGSGRLDVHSTDGNIELNQES